MPTDDDERRVDDFMLARRKNTYAQQIKQLISKKGMTAVAAAEVLGIPPIHMQAVVLGVPSVFTIDQLREMLIVLGPGKRLDQAECDSLPIGSRVMVIWSGGNGPFIYEVTDNRQGKAWLGACNSVLNQVGDHPLTIVWLLD